MRLIEPFLARAGILGLLIFPAAYGYVAALRGNFQKGKPSAVGDYHNIHNAANRHTFVSGLRAEATSSSSSSSSSSEDLPKLAEEASTNLLSEAKLENSLTLLKEAIAFNSSAASNLLEGIKEMREKQIPRETIDDYLDAILRAGPDARLPVWSRPKVLGRLSQRSRMFSLRRALDMTTPPSSEIEEGQDEKFNKQRRRRALISILNNIANDDITNPAKKPIIVSIERKAKKASRELSTDLRSRLPEGLESPNYEVLDELKSRKGRVEVRRYDSYSVCSVSMSKPRPEESAKAKTDAKVQMPEMKGASAFGALAGYLFGKNDKEKPMKMTTPVFTGAEESSSSNKDRQMEFVLPSTYWSSEQFDEAPKPLPGSGVTLQRKDREDRAVLMFGGYASKKEVGKRKGELKEILSMNDSSWVIEEDDITVAQYNDPFTVPWKRLNEVSLKVSKATADEST